MEKSFLHAERRHKFIMWSVVVVLALFSAINVLRVAMQGSLGEWWDGYMATHDTVAQLVKSTGRPPPI